MKKITSILALVLALSWMSCTPEAITSINEITDHYVVPTDAIELTTLTSAESTWSLDRRYFNLAFSGNGTTLETRLVGFDALLTPGQYQLDADIIGKAITENTKLNGKAVQDGYFFVTKKDNDYQITATLGDDILFWKGALPFEPDPDPIMLTDVLQAQSNKASGVNSLTMQLATTGLHQEMTPDTYQQVWVGEGKYLALDIYSDDGYLHEGNYTPSAEGGNIQPGEFGIGYDTTMEFWGQVYEMKDWGTCLWTVAEGAATAEKILDGMVSVSSREETIDEKDVTIWTIFWGKEYPREVLFEGPIPALTKPKASSEFDYTYKEEELQDVADGVKKHPITIMDAEGNTVAYFEFLMADGITELTEGVYPSTSYASAAGQLADGYFGDFGDYHYEGGSYYISESGEKVFLQATQWNVELKKLVKGAYEFIGTPTGAAAPAFDFKASGEGYVPGSYKDPNAPTVYDMTDAIAVDCTDANNTLYDNVESHTLVLKDGEEFVAQIKLVRSVGTMDLSGTYTVGEYAHEDMVAANGFDLGAMFGMEPGSWVIGSYYIKDGSIVIVEPGETITVTSEGADTYKFVGSTGYTFVGKL